MAGTVGQGSCSAMLALLGTVTVLLMSLKGAAATTYLVGNTQWTFPPASNSELYDDWSAQQNFVVGDILEFKYDAVSHNVASLSTAEAFSTCDINSAVQLPPSGNTNITLTSNGVKWYICAVPGHCDQGMKVKIVVGSASGGGPSGAPSDSPTTPHSAAPRVASAIGYGTAAAVVISAASFLL